METAKPGDRRDAPDYPHSSMERSILVQRKVRGRSVVVAAIICQQMAKVIFAEHHDVVEALASDRSDQPSDMAVLPRRARRDRPVANTHGENVQNPGVIRPLDETDAGPSVRLLHGRGEGVATAHSTSGLWIDLLALDREGGMKWRVIVELGGVEGTVRPVPTRLSSLLPTPRLPRWLRPPDTKQTAHSRYALPCNAACAARRGARKISRPRLHDRQRADLVGSAVTLRYQSGAGWSL